MNQLATCDRDGDEDAPGCSPCAKAVEAADKEGDLARYADLMNQLAACTAEQDTTFQKRIMEINKQSEIDLKTSLDKALVARLSFETT